MQSLHLRHRAAAPVRLIATTFLLTALPAIAQKSTLTSAACGETGTRTTCADYREFHSVTKTFYLSNVSQQNDANEVLVALRNILDPSIKIYLVASQNAIVLRALPEDLEAAQRLIDDLTHPHKTYDLAFTLTTTEDGEPLPPETVHLTVTSGQRATFKQGDKVPVATSHPTDDKTEAQMTYLDAGMNIDATLSDTNPGLSLKTKIERSFVEPGTAPTMALHPTIGQSVLEEVTSLPIGKPRKIGSITEPHRSVTIEALATPIN